MNGQVVEMPQLNTLHATRSTQKYQEYSAEIVTKLAGKLSQGERRRLEHERALLSKAQFIELNGIVHHYQDIGPRGGEPLVLIHGWDCSALWWHHIVEPLAAAGYRVISYDLKGHGFSDSDPARGYTVEGFSSDLHALGIALGLRPHHVAAFSLGAFVALHYGATYPDQVRSLTFFNFSQISHSRVASVFIPPLLDTVFNRLLRPITRRGLWWLPFIYARLVLAQNTPPVGDIKLGALSLRCCDPEAVRVSAHELARREVLDAVPDQMRRVPHPTLLVSGAGDPIMRPSGGRKLMSVAQQGTYLEVPKCGHLILFELPEQVTQILRLFLRGVRG
ncbi:alpha/beta hydrolase [Oscillochloris sp. ZM17-4]|uniref:alpha/beta fold hydrolase n=1 Tax=Oscillochloris sp. ZM17-4 TaxID=2866714 RepID=UPI001C72F6AF|nr:alpha/beta hydrolase [Oscillochloris sp. ZM17-4]MBX0330795.1 alpha/beta hydrolase [Oscillochloris sp. ZM17-4]